MSKTEEQIGEQWYSLPRWAKIRLTGMFAARFAMANVCVVQCWLHAEPWEQSHPSCLLHLGDALMGLFL